MGGEVLEEHGGGGKRVRTDGELKAVARVQFVVLLRRPASAVGLGLQPTVDRSDQKGDAGLNTGLIARGGTSGAATLGLLEQALSHEWVLDMYCGQ